MSAHRWRLAIDASTYAGTVAVLREDAVVTARDIAMRGEREERLMPAVVEVLADTGIVPNDLTAVICGDGPGSFTSLRIAASIAKGLAHATGAPLQAVPSLALLVADARESLGDGRFLATFDALRGEHYAALVTLDGGTVTAYEYLGVRADASLEDLAHAHALRRIAPDATHAPRARAVVALGALLRDAGPVDLDAWEPNYGRKAEAQVKWELAHGRALPTSPAPNDSVTA